MKLNRHIYFRDGLYRRLFLNFKVFLMQSIKRTFYRRKDIEVPDILGYARVSTADQELEPQKSRLKEAGATRIFDDVISGRTFKRPGFSALIDYARPGDIVCVVRLNRLGHSLKELLETVGVHCSFRTKNHCRTHKRWISFFQKS